MRGGNYFQNEDLNSSPVSWRRQALFMHNCNLNELKHKDANLNFLEYAQACKLKNTLS